MYRSHDFRMLTAVHCRAAVQEEVAQHAPCRWNFELDEKIEQSVDDFAAFDLTGAAKFVRTKQIQRPPDQLKVDADCEHASF